MPDTTSAAQRDRPRFVRDLLDLLAEHGTRPRTETLIHGLLDTMACKAAERSSHCPHGRPTILHLTLRDPERQFKRR